MVETYLGDKFVIIALSEPTLQLWQAFEEQFKPKPCVMVFDLLYSAVDPAI